MKKIFVCGVILALGLFQIPALAENNTEWTTIGDWEDLVNIFQQDSVNAPLALLPNITIAPTKQENGIMNMALLDEQTNKAYKNVIFPMKRKYIMDKMGRDNFVPICTKNVFLKYYTGEVTQFYVWDENDRNCYFDKMCSSIYEYLTGNSVNEEIVEVEGEE